MSTDRLHTRQQSGWWIGKSITLLRADHFYPYRRYFGVIDADGTEVLARVEPATREQIRKIHEIHKQEN